MRVLVKRFCLSYGRRIYKAGEVADIADEKTAKELIARSGGDLEACGETGPAPEKPDARKKPDVSDDDGGAVSLPAVDPVDAVQGVKSKGRKK